MNPFKFLCAIVLCFTTATQAAESIDPTVAEVLRADLARGAALRAADTNALKVILADDFRYTHSSGYVESKATHIKSFVDGLRYARFETTNVVGRIVTPDVVVLNGIIDQRKGVAEKWTDYHLLFQAVWRKAASGWQLVNLQTAAPPVSAKR
jgi:hypothetical protein